MVFETYCTWRDSPSYCGRGHGQGPEQESESERDDRKERGRGGCTRFVALLQSFWPFTTHPFFETEHRGRERRQFCVRCKADNTSMCQAPSLSVERGVWLHSSVRIALHKHPLCQVCQAVLNTVQTRALAYDLCKRKHGPGVGAKSTSFFSVTFRCAKRPTRYAQDGPWVCWMPVCFDE